MAARRRNRIGSRDKYGGRNVKSWGDQVTKIAVLAHSRLFEHTKSLTSSTTTSRLYVVLLFLGSRRENSRGLTLSTYGNRFLHQHAPDFDKAAGTSGAHYGSKHQSSISSRHGYLPFRVWHTSLERFGINNIWQ